MNLVSPVQIKTENSLPKMKTYQIKWIGSIYKTIEIKAKNEDEAIDLFNSGEGKTISFITKHDDIEQITEVIENEKQKKLSTKEVLNNEN